MTQARPTGTGAPSTGAGGEGRRKHHARTTLRPRGRDYFLAALIVLGSTGLAAVMEPGFDPSNLIMVYLLGVMAAALSLGRGPAVLASVLSVASFDFFFVPPRLTLSVADAQYLVTFGIMLMAALLIGTLAARLRAQVQSARVDQHRSRSLSKLSGELVGLQDRDLILAAVLRHVEEVFESRAVVLLPEAGGRLAVVAGDPALLGSEGEERGVAQWAFDAGHAAGLGTDTLPGSHCLHLPLRGTRRELGVMAVMPGETGRLLAPATFRLLEAFANHAALAIERGQLAEQAEHARIQGETERLRSALLSSVSHDLRTPLAVITGVTSTLLEAEETLALDDRREMLKTVADEAARLNRLVANLLAMTRLEAGALEVKRSWHSIEEIVGAALRRLDPFLAGRPVTVDVASEVPLVPVDDVLIEQVIFNLVENAVKVAPPSEPIGIRARAGAENLEVVITDRGPGFPSGTEDRLFEKFYRGEGSPGGGVGLGLAISRGIVEAHGGRITAANRHGGGARFAFTLPLGAGAPTVEQEPPPIEDPQALGERHGG